MQFARTLHTRLESAGITAYRLSQLTGISKGAMSKLLSGKVEPSWESVLKIAKAMGVSCEVFAADVELPDAPEQRGPGRPPADLEQVADRPPAKRKKGKR